MQTLFVEFDETDKKMLKFIAYLRYCKMDFRIEPELVVPPDDWDENLTFEEFLNELDATEP
jgi:hypothetical protein